MLTASDFYSQADTVESYERGRVDRVFVRDLLRLLPLIGRADSAMIPLSAVFDWIYHTRLRACGVDFLSEEVLDIACGTSYVYRCLFSEGWCGRVSGVDISAAMLAAGTRELERLLSDRPTGFHTYGPIYCYRDALGRRMLDVAPPARIVDTDSVCHLIENRVASDIRSMGTKSFSAVSAFSGPLCFFPLAEQKRVLEMMAARAEKAIIVQVKNHDFFSMNQCASGVRQVAGIIDYILSNGIVDSRAFLSSMRFAERVRFDPVSFGASVQHEVARFAYYLTPRTLLEEWLDDLGFVVAGVTTMGFASETYFRLIADHYRRFAANPSAARRCLEAVLGIDQYFCVDKLMGDNLQFAAVRKNEVAITEIAFKAEATYRQDYKVTTDEGTGRFWSATEEQRNCFQCGIAAIESYG